VQNYSNAVEQTKKTHEMGDVQDVGDAEEAPSPKQDDVWTSRKHKQGDSQYLNKNNGLFYKTFGHGNPEEEPTPTERKAEQRLNIKHDFFYPLLGNNSPPVASSTLEEMAEGEGSSLGGLSLGSSLGLVPQSTETSWEQQKEGSSVLNKTGNSSSPDDVLVQGDLFETKVNHHLRLLIADEALRAFIAQVVQALRMDCSLPEVQLACAKLVWKTGLLIKLLNERQNDQEASALTGQCLLEGNVSDGTALTGVTGTTLAGKLKPAYTSSDKLLLVISLFVLVMINLAVICLVEVCSQKPAAASQPRSTSRSHPRWFFQKFLPGRWSKNKDDVREQGSPVSDLSKIKPQWLRDLYQPLDSQDERIIAELYDEETSDEEEIFNRSGLK
ncbi:L37A1 protein, partial [Nyctiprogne leucopyga]|nr:L37A1 protein [Nyctiprogne leucopyga]